MNKSRAIFLNGKWEKVENCRDCYIVYADEYITMCGETETEFCLMKNNVPLPDCPLPFLSDVIEHGADERPGNDGDKKSNRNVLVSISNITNDEKPFQVIGRNDGYGWAFDSVIDGLYKGINRGIYEVISWRELNPNGGTDGID